MKLLNKTLIIISLTLAGMILLMYVSSQTILLNSYATLERQDMEADVTSAHITLNSDLAMLDSVNADYATWDDSYVFADQAAVEDDDPYVTANWVDATFRMQKLSLVAYLNADDKVLFARSYDPVNQSFTDLPEGFEAQIQPGSPLIRSRSNDSAHGIVMFGGKPALVSAYPIRNSAGDAPPKGTLIMGRYLDGREVQAIENITGQSLAIQPYSGSGSSDDYAVAKAVLARGPSTFVQPIGDTTVGGYTVLDDIYGNPALILRVDKPRSIFTQGENSLVYFIVSLLLAGLVFSVVMFVLLEKMVVSPISQLSDTVQKIGTAGGEGTRVPAAGDDEVAALARTINRTMDTLDQSRRELEASEQKFRGLVENLGEVVWEADGQYLCTYISPNVKDLLGFEPAEILGRSILDLASAKEVPQLRFLLAKLHADQAPISRFETVVLDRQGHPIDLEISSTKIRDAQGQIRGFHGIARDVRERKRTAEELQQAYDETIRANRALQSEIAERTKAEGRILASLKEKEVLLKEIHHRVKNNMQIISSLLSLQSASMSGGNASAFKESQNRIKSMALIHEKLYSSQDLARVDFGEYVSSLTAYLARSYTSGHSVQFVLDIQDVSLDIDMAIPCGLIINELVSNSLKYAFGSGPGEIRISVSREESQFTLEVSDNGTGLPEGFDFRESASLGLQLVNTLVDQIEGEIELLPGPGTRFRVSFPGAARPRGED